MNTEFYNQLKDLVEIHDKCTANGEDIFCFDLIKKIVDGEVLKENINDEQQVLAYKQLVESLEWFQMIGITIEFQEELLKILG